MFLWFNPNINPQDVGSFVPCCLGQFVKQIIANLSVPPTSEQNSASSTTRRLFLGMAIEVPMARGGRAPLATHFAHGHVGRCLSPTGRY